MRNHVCLCRNAVATTMERNEPADRHVNSRNVVHTESRTRLTPSQLELERSGLYQKRIGPPHLGALMQTATGMYGAST